MVAQVIGVYSDHTCGKIQVVVMGDIENFHLR